MRSATVLVAALTLPLVACAPPGQSPPATPLGTAMPPAKPPEAGPAWQLEWERTLEAARKEGKVAILGPVEADIRQALVEPFQRKFGIEVDYLALPGGQMSVRVRTEREAGKSLWDIYISGTTTALTELKPIKALDPIEPHLISREVKEPRNWLDSKLWFADRGRFNTTGLRHQLEPGQGPRVQVF